MIVVAVDPLEGTAMLAEAAGSELEGNEFEGTAAYDELCVGAAATELALTVTFCCSYEIPVARKDGP